jgi:hypothetical protein
MIEGTVMVSTDMMMAEVKLKLAPEDLKKTRDSLDLREK